MPRLLSVAQSHGEQSRPLGTVPLLDGKRKTDHTLNAETKSPSESVRDEHVVMSGGS